MEAIKNLEKQIQQTISEVKNSINSLKIKQVVLVVLFVAFAIALMEFYRTKYWIYLAGAEVLLIVVLYFVIKKYNVLKKFHNELVVSNDYIRRNFPKKAIDHLIQAYKYGKMSKVLEFLFLYTTIKQADLQQHSEIALLELEDIKAKKNSDRKLIEILKQILFLNSNIQKHKEFIAKSKRKIMELEEQINYAIDEKLIIEYKKLIDRYKQIIKSETEKIEVNQQKIEKLIKMKHNFLITQKIIKAREELKKLEDELWENSISEQILDMDSQPEPNVTLREEKVKLKQVQSDRDVEKFKID